MEEIAKKPKKENFWLNLGLNVVLPAVIMTKFSKPEYLGQKMGLLVALSFPFGYGVYDYIKEKKVNFLSALGLISVLLTGGIGLLALNKVWMVVKETAIPALMGIAVLISQKMKTPLIKSFMGQILNLEKINSVFKEKGHEGVFEQKLRQTTYLFSITFFISALLNYILAVEILKGEPGSVEFTESIGRMTALSFPVITVPMMIMVSIVLYILLHSIKKYTGLELEEVINEP